jgi:hypothetical protein
MTRSISRKLTAVAVAFTAATSFMACDDETAAITGSEFVSRSNAICAANAEKADALYAEILEDAARTPENAQAFLERLVPVFRNGVDDRREIPAPEGDEETVDAINSAGDEATAGFEAAAKTPQASAALMRGLTPDPAVEYDRLSAEYGVDGCVGDE